MSDFPVSPAADPVEPAPVVAAYAPVVPAPEPAPPAVLAVATPAPTRPEEGSLSEIVAWLEEHARWAERHVMSLFSKV
jgi:hypothetical protein